MIDYLAHVRADGSRLSAAARSVSLDIPVPSCPDWVMRDLVAHIGGVHRQKEATVRERATDSPPFPEAPDDGLIEWYDEGLERLLDTLDAADPRDEVWTWVPENPTVGFWYRRMAHETLIHRVDAELAAGGLTEVDEMLATDGVDELLGWMTSAPEWATVTPGERFIRIVTPGAEWMVGEALFSGISPETGTEYENLPMLVRTDDGAADCTIRGTGADIDLWLWGRGPIESLEIEGDAELAAALRELSAEETQ